MSDWNFMRLGEFRLAVGPPGHTSVVYIVGNPATPKSEWRSAATVEDAKRHAVAEARDCIHEHLRIFTEAKAALDAYEDAHPGPVSDGSGPSHPND